jgi:hypothetical protein
MACTDDAFVCNIFVQLKNELLPHDFKSEFTTLERCWQMDKEILTSQSLMDDASTYNTNMVASGDGKTEVNKHTQIIALTTPISELKKEFHPAKASNNTFTPAFASSGSGSNKSEQWRLEKVDNKEEFNMIMKDGRTYYWCNEHKYPLSNVQGMYVFHTPTDHEVWLAHKTSLNTQCEKGGKEKAATPAPAPPPKPSLTQSATKVSLAKSLQEALMTTAGLTDNQFNKIWVSCCSALGN